LLPGAEQTFEGSFFGWFHKVNLCRKISRKRPKTTIFARLLQKGINKQHYGRQ
jgi:hypothetical protein